jgi:hypothetical protein
MMGFTSTQIAALGPDNLVSFETLPGVTNQFPGGYFAAGCAMHLSHLYEAIDLWYNSFNYSTRLSRMFSPRTALPADENTVTLPNGPAQVSTVADVKSDLSTYGVLGHNATLQTASRLRQDVIDNYGRLRAKGTAVPVREDFNTLDSPFFKTSYPERDKWNSTPNQPGLHFVVFVPTSQRFHTARQAMDGLIPNPDDTITNLRVEPNFSDAQNGINTMIKATHRQNFLVPPRSHRSFPLIELMK